MPVFNSNQIAFCRNFAGIPYRRVVPVAAFYCMNIRDLCAGVFGGNRFLLCNRFFSRNWFLFCNRFFCGNRFLFYNSFFCRNRLIIQYDIIKSHIRLTIRCRLSRRRINLYFYCTICYICPFNRHIGTPYIAVKSCVNFSQFNFVIVLPSKITFMTVSVS